jgi:hypothetical protein
MTPWLAFGIGFVLGVAAILASIIWVAWIAAKADKQNRYFPAPVRRGKTRIQI